MTANFLIENRERELNGIKLEDAIIADAHSFDEYLEFIMCMGYDALGPLLMIVPIVMRININIYNIDTSP